MHARYSSSIDFWYSARALARESIFAAPQPASMSAQSTTNIRVMAMTPDALISCLRVAKAWRARRDTVGGVPPSDSRQASIITESDHFPAVSSNHDPMVYSPLEQPHNLRLRQRIEMQVEADDRRRCIGLHVEIVGLHREHGEQIAVRMVALGWTRPA